MQVVGPKDFLQDAGVRSMCSMVKAVKVWKPDEVAQLHILKCW